MSSTRNKGKSVVTEKFKKPLDGKSIDKQN